MMMAPENSFACCLKQLRSVRYRTKCLFILSCTSCTRYFNIPSLCGIFLQAEKFSFFLNMCFKNEHAEHTVAAVIVDYSSVYPRDDRYRMILHLRQLHQALLLCSRVIPRIWIELYFILIASQAHPIL